MDEENDAIIATSEGLVCRSYGVTTPSAFDDLSIGFPVDKYDCFDGLS